MRWLNATRAVGYPAPVAIHRPGALCLALLAAACEPTFPVDDGPGLSGDRDQLHECDPALGLTPVQAYVEPLGLIIFQPSGGEGEYVFTITSEEAAGEIDPMTGLYRAGETVGSVDEIRLNGRSCTGSVEATVNVVDELAVAPRVIDVAREQEVLIEARGGSGVVACELSVSETGGEVCPAGGEASPVGGEVCPLAGGQAGCRYVAGTLPGTDVVTVIDTRTGAVLDTRITVTSDATFTVVGHGHIFVPAGHHFRPTPVGGSGVVDIEVVSGPLWDDGVELWSDVPAEGVVSFIDHYLPGVSVEVPVTVVGELVPAGIRPDGELSGRGVVPDTGDLNDDGYPDAVLGFIELAEGAHYSGAVLVYEGTATSLRPRPVQVFGGTTTFEGVGRDVDIADVNGDGEADLIIGVDGLDSAGTNSGGVRIHYGVHDGFFEEETSRLLRGETTGDRFGTGVAACDFDNDTYMDLAVGADEDVNANVGQPASDQGAVHVYRGGKTGFSDRADFIIFGQLPDAGGELVNAPSMRFGGVVRAGDLNDDGMCDLVVGAPDGAYDGGAAVGTVLVFHGTRDNNLLLSRTPSVLYVGDATDGNFGNAVAIGDVDDDGINDLAIAHYRSNHAASRGGAVYIHRGPIEPLEAGEELTPIPPAAADWVVGGTAGLDYLGADIALSDLHPADGHADLVVGISRGEEVFLNTGHLTVYDGATITGDMDAEAHYDATNDTPLVFIDGEVRLGRLGQAVGVVGNRGLLALAGWESTYGTEMGAPYFVSLESRQPQLLEMPSESSGHELGQAMELFDIDGDGDQDLVIGAPGAADEAYGANSGLVFAYTWNGDRFVEPPARFSNGYPNHAGGNRYGYAIEDVGDFDGDGFDDLAIVARGEGRPSSFDAAVYVNPDDCAGSASLVGATYIFLGSASGLRDEPSFVAFGPDEDSYTRMVAGRIDLDGDAYGDVVIGSYSWGQNLQGGFTVLYGRPADPAGITVLCLGDVYREQEEFAYLGQSAVSLGDLDGDGCDDLAVGSARANLGTADQGIVRFLWGWGGAGCPAEPQLTTAGLGIVFAQAGSSLDSGRDLDGDGIADLAVGGPEFRDDFALIGAAWWVPGAHILDLPREPLVGTTMPDELETVVYDLVPTVGSYGRLGLTGPMAASLYGESVALMADPLDPAKAAVAIGVPLGNYGGTEFSGGLVIHRYVDDSLHGLPGLEQLPYAIFAGESGRPGSQLGSLVEAVEIDGSPALLVGAPRSSQVYLEGGAVYVLKFPPP